MTLRPEDQARIAAAIAEAERQTSGEIYCIYARAAHRYRSWLIALSAFLGFAVPPASALLGFGPEAWTAAVLGGGWRDAHGGLGERETVGLLAAAQALVFLLVLALSWWSPLAQRWAPRALRQRRVHALATQHFLAHGLHLTEARTGVLLFVSELDHVAEVVADKGIHRLVGESVWVETVAALLEGLRRQNPVQGFLDAIGIAGAVLAEHFPPRPGNPNELPNRLVVV